MEHYVDGEKNIVTNYIKMVTITTKREQTHFVIIRVARVCKITKILYV